MDAFEVDYTGPPLWVEGFQPPANPTPIEAARTRVFRAIEQHQRASIFNPLFAANKKPIAKRLALLSQLEDAEFDRAQLDAVSTPLRLKIGATNGLEEALYRTGREYEESLLTQQRRKEPAKALQEVKTQLAEAKAMQPTLHLPIDEKKGELLAAYESVHRLVTQLQALSDKISLQSVLDSIRTSKKDPENMYHQRQTIADLRGAGNSGAGEYARHTYNWTFGWVLPNLSIPERSPAFIAKQEEVKTAADALAEIVDQLEQSLDKRDALAHRIEELEEREAQCRDALTTSPAAPGQLEQQREAYLAAQTALRERLITLQTEQQEIAAPRAHRASFEEAFSHTVTATRVRLAFSVLTALSVSLFSLAMALRYRILGDRLDALAIAAAEMTPTRFYLAFATPSVCIVPGLIGSALRERTWARESVARLYEYRQLSQIEQNKPILTDAAIQTWAASQQLPPAVAAHLSTIA